LRFGKFEGFEGPPFPWVAHADGSFGVAFHGAVIFTNGKVADISCAYKLEKNIIFDLSQTQEEKLDGVFMCIENFKNGRIFSPKYESHTKTFIKPRVFVFSNFHPDQSMLSVDRWDIVDLNI
jgi:hypothetical protein